MQSILCNLPIIFLLFMAMVSVQASDIDKAKGQASKCNDELAQNGQIEQILDNYQELITSYIEDSSYFYLKEFGDEQREEFKIYFKRRPYDALEFLFYVEFMKDYEITTQDNKFNGVFQDFLMALESPNGNMHKTSKSRLKREEVELLSNFYYPLRKDKSIDEISQTYMAAKILESKLNEEGIKLSNIGLVYTTTLLLGIRDQHISVQEKLDNDGSFPLTDYVLTNNLFIKCLKAVKADEYLSRVVTDIEITGGKELAAASLEMTQQEKVEFLNTIFVGIMNEFSDFTRFNPSGGGATHVNSAKSFVKFRFAKNRIFWQKLVLAGIRSNPTAISSLSLLDNLSEVVTQKNNIFIQELEDSKSEKDPSSKSTVSSYVYSQVKTSSRPQQELNPNKRKNQLQKESVTPELGAKTEDTKNSKINRETTLVIHDFYRKDTEKINNGLAEYITNKILPRIEEDPLSSGEIKLKFYYKDPPRVIKFMYNNVYYRLAFRIKLTNSELIISLMGTERRENFYNTMKARAKHFNAID